MASASAAVARLDAIVVGAGVMGSAAAHALVSCVGRRAAGERGTRPLSVALLEQYEFGHKHGSSHGHSRIIRPVYSEPHYASLMPEAYDRWRAIDATTQDTCYTRTGGLYWGPVGFTDPSGDNVHSHRGTCDALGVEYEMLSSVEVASRWPPLDTPAAKGWEGLYNPDCGILHADTCVATLQQAARAGGVSLHEHCTVTGIRGGREGEPVTVTTSDGRCFEANHAIICAGPWAGELLAKTTGLRMALQPTQNTVAYWPADKGRADAFMAGRFPVLISDCGLGKSKRYGYARSQLVQSHTCYSTLPAEQNRYMGQDRSMESHLAQRKSGASGNSTGTVAQHWVTTSWSTKTQQKAHVRSRSAPLSSRSMCAG